MAARRRASRHRRAVAAPAVRGHRRGAACLPCRLDPVPVQHVNHSGSPPSPFLSSSTNPACRRPEPPRPSRRRASPAARARSARPSLGRRAALGAEVLPVRWDRASPTGVTITRSSSSPTDGVRALLGGGPATTMIAFGTSVTVGGRAGRARPSPLRRGLGTTAGLANRAARAAGKPAFVVFDDKTLRLVAAVCRPTRRPARHQRDRPGEARELWRRSHRTWPRMRHVGRRVTAHESGPDLDGKGTRWAEKSLSG